MTTKERAKLRNIVGRLQVILEELERKHRLSPGATARCKTLMKIAAASAHHRSGRGAPPSGGYRLGRSLKRLGRLNQQGAIWLYIDEVTEAYLDFAGQQKTVLEIAAGYGHLVVKALDDGARKVFANEIDPGQLAIIKARTPQEYLGKLVRCLGEFPEFLDFAGSLFDAIYNARLFHFFDGERIRMSLDKIYRWLRPGGKVFLVNDAIYRTIFKPLIPIYESRIAARDTWPGFIEDVRSCIPEHLHPENYPRTMNFLDPAVFTRELNRAGFRVEDARVLSLYGEFCPCSFGWPRDCRCDWA